MLEIMRETPYLAARIEKIPEATTGGPEIEARFSYLKAARHRGPVAPATGARRSWRA